jgi:hypothetical protein
VRVGVAPQQQIRRVEATERRTQAQQTHKHTHAGTHARRHTYARTHADADKRTRRRRQTHTRAPCRGRGCTHLPARDRVVAARIVRQVPAMVSVSWLCRRRRRALRRERAERAIMGTQPHSRVLGYSRVLTRTREYWGTRGYSGVPLLVGIVVRRVLARHDLRKVPVLRR